MPVITLPSGLQIELGDPGEEKRQENVQTVKDIAGFAGESARKMGASGLRTGADFLKIIAGGGPIGMLKEYMGVPQDPLTSAVQGLIGKTGEKAASAIDVPDTGGGPSGEGPMLWDKAVRGIGAAGALPIPGAGMKGFISQLFSGGIGGITGELGGRLADNFTDTKESPKVRLGAELAGNMFGGVPTGYLTAPRQSVARQDIRRAATGLKPEDFAGANRAAEQAREAGISNLTASEAFPPNSGMAALGKQTREGSPDNPLRAATQNRPQEIQDLGTTFLNRILGRSVSPNRVANETAEAATGAELTTKRLAQDALDNRLEGQIVKPQQVITMEDNLKSLAMTKGRRPNERESYLEVANQLRDADGKPLTSTQQLSWAIKGLKASAKNPLVTTATGATISGTDLKIAIAAAEKMLGDISPAFRQGMEEFSSFNQGPRAFQTRGPVGSLAFANPLKEKQIDPARLNSLLDRNDPADITGTARILSNPDMTGGPTARPLEIARAIAQQKLHLGPENPGTAVRGTEGSGAQKNLEALLRAGGNNAENTLAPLAVADRLQGFSQPAGIHELPRMHIGPRLLRTIDMLLTKGKEEGITRELGDLLKSSSPEDLKKLQEIAMFNPAIRKAITQKAAIMPLLQNQPEQ